MILSHLRPCLAILVVAAMSVTGPSLGGARTNPANLCVAAAQKAAQATGVPLRVLLALTLTETGRRDPEGRLIPWPWALNKGGESMWLDSLEEAQVRLEDELSQGTTNIDVGCFQLNHRWHGSAFDSLDTMLDPATNALYAARLMLQLYQDSGDWSEAAAAYHSATPEYAERYLSRFKPIYNSLSELPETSDVASAPEKERGPNRFPLLLAGQSRGAGSLVPMGQAATPLFGGP